MKIYKGKNEQGGRYFAIRFKNDLCIGVGRPPQWMRDEALRYRPHAGI